MRARWLVLAILGSSTANAEPAELSIWYRSSEACPTAEAFFERLSQLGRRARLAGAGDNIDFVVTLGGAGDGSFGRLERQAESGTIAIREVQAPKCEEVAEALALSLDLALAPMQAPAAGPQPPPPVAPAPATTASLPATASPTVANDDDPPPPAAPPVEDTDAGPAVGAQALILTGIAPNAMFGGALSVELALPFGMSARLSGYAGWGQSTVEKGDLEHQLIAARLEGCSPRLGWSAWELGVCLGVDAGLLRAEYSGPSGSTDSGPWGAATVLGRAGFRASPAFTIEAQAGALLPWVRYETGDPEGDVLAEGDAVVVTAGVGVSYRFGAHAEPEKWARSQGSTLRPLGR